MVHQTVGRQRALRIVCLARFKARDAFSVRHLISNKSGPVAVVVGPRARAVLPYGLGSKNKGRRSVPNALNRE